MTTKKEVPVGYEIRKVDDKPAPYGLGTYFDVILKGESITKFPLPKTYATALRLAEKHAAGPQFVTIICEETGLPFQAENRRSKLHPAVLNLDSYEAGWREERAAAIAAGRKAGFTTPEQFNDAIRATRAAVFAKRAEQEARAALEKKQNAERHAAWLAEQKALRARPVVANRAFERGYDAAGEFAVVDGRILLCTSASYAADSHEEAADGGYFCEYAEPTEAEIASPAYQKLVSSTATAAKAQAAEKAFEALLLQATSAVEVEPFPIPTEIVPARLSSEGGYMVEEVWQVEINGVACYKTYNSRSAGSGCYYYSAAPDAAGLTRVVYANDRARRFRGLF